MARELARMRRDWDRRARENARYYVATSREDWSDDEFHRSGEATVEQQILNDMENICQGRDPREMKVLEIGCGAGRITRALASRFGEVHGVDISAEMIRQARQALAGMPNAHVYRNNGKDLSVLCGSWWRRLAGGSPRPFDFAFSFIVFQHIPSRAIIENYVREVNRCLRPGALFKFQVQGCPQVKDGAGDSWLGVSFTEAEARDMACRCGFELRYNHGAGDQYYWLWCFKKEEIR